MTKHRYFPVAILLAMVILAIAIMLRIDYNRQLQEAERQAFWQAWEEQGDVARRLFEENSDLCQAIVATPTEEARDPLLLDLQDKYREITGYLYPAHDPNSSLIFSYSKDFEDFSRHTICIFYDCLSYEVGPVEYWAYLVYQPDVVEDWSSGSEETFPLSSHWSFLKTSYGLV